MRAVVVEDANRVVVRDVPEPRPPGPYEALAKVVCGSLCNNTDLKIAHRQLHFVKDYPTILGHEVVGRVVEVGSEVRSFGPGDMISRPHAAVPPETGLFESWGGFTEYGLVTDTRAMAEAGLTTERPTQIPAPPDFDPVALSQMITLRETLSFLSNLGVTAGQSVLIFGTGPVGVAFSLVADQLGLSPRIVVGRRQAALERALHFGRATHVIDNTRERVPEAVRRITGGAGVDWAIEAIGADAVLPEAFDSLNAAGWVGLYGVPPAAEVGSPLRRSDRVKQAAVVEAAANETIMDWVTRRLVPAREFVTHELPMAEVARGLELLERKEAFKVALWMEPR